MQKGELFFEEKNSLAFGIYLFGWFTFDAAFFCSCSNKEGKTKRKKTEYDNWK